MPERTTSSSGDHADDFWQSLGQTRRIFLRQVAGTGAAVAFVALPERGSSAEVAKASRAVDGAVDLRLKINGRDVDVQIDPRTTLLDLLREGLQLTGSKKGCDHGQCGACTVLINGQRVNSCLSLAVVHNGDEITTIEGLAQGETLHPVQAAFLEQDGFQCGYCTPGQICSAVALMQEGHANSDDEIREWMSGNICRCGAYANIVAAIREAKSKVPSAA